jgi:hypothetical protein
MTVGKQVIAGLHAWNKRALRIERRSVREGPRARTALPSPCLVIIFSSFKIATAWIPKTRLYT